MAWPTWTRAQYSDNGRDLRLADDRQAMLWLLQNVQGSPVILEAQIPEYRWGSRFGNYTGLPTVQGWNWHQRQQRSVVPSIAVERRVKTSRSCTTPPILRAHSLLELYGVQYIIVGELERATYSPEGLAKFDMLAEQGLLKPVYPGRGHDLRSRGSRHGGHTVGSRRGADAGAGNFRFTAGMMRVA